MGHRFCLITPGDQERTSPKVADSRRTEAHTVHARVSHGVECTVWSALVIGAVYMLRAVRNVLHGPECELESTPKDASGFSAKLPYALLLAALLLFGFWPRLLTDKISASAQKIVPAQSQQTAHR